MNPSMLMNWVIPDISACRQEADRLREKYPNETAEELAGRALADARLKAASAGAVLSVASTPLTAIPAALTDAAAVLKIEGFLAGTAAALLDPDTLNHPEQFRTDVLAVVFPGMASQALRTMGVRGATRFTARLIRSHSAEKLSSAIVRIAARYLGVHLSRKALLTKTIPLVSAGVGSGWNWLEVQAVGKRGISYFQSRIIGTPLTKRPGLSRLLRFGKEKAD